MRGTAEEQKRFAYTSLLCTIFTIWHILLLQDAEQETCLQGRYQLQKTLLSLSLLLILLL